jgi:glycosyltransferase involved in cell wall biosynthesis
MRRVQSIVQHRGWNKFARASGRIAWLGEPKRLAELQFGIEDFNFPGSQSLLSLTPEPPDIVHCHNLHGGYFDLRVLSQMSHEVPVILNLRDEWLLTGHCAYTLDCTRWKSGCGKCPYLNTYPSIQRDRSEYNWRRKRNIYNEGYFYVTTPSQWLMNNVSESMLQGVKYRVIANGIDLTVFCCGDKYEARQKLNLPKDAKIILLTAHSKFKDLATIEASIPKVHKHNDDGGLLYVCMGKVNNEKSIGHGRMIFPGFESDPSKMALYYRASDIFIHAAKAEAFGKTVAEAMACGTPVVATSVGGIPEQIVNGKTGFLTPACDAISMGHYVNLILDDPELQSRLSCEAAAYAQQHFDLNRQADEFIDWYGEVIDDWRMRYAK